MLLDSVQFLVDIFHVSKRTEEVCMPLENPNCLYHPHLPKYYEISGVNTESCKQGFKDVRANCLGATLLVTRL